MYKTAEQILALAEKKSQTILGQIRFINKFFRAQDDSSMWPINGRFSVTERAIRHARKFEREGGVMTPYEYALFLEAEESRIVNDPSNQ